MVRTACFVGPYHLPRQRLLSCELMVVPAAVLKYIEPTVMIEIITHDRQGPAHHVNSSQVFS
jgi:hypothetical protein